MKSALFGVGIVVAFVALFLSESKIRSSLYKSQFSEDYELIYFDVQGKGQQIRFFFDFFNLKYVDTRPTWDEWQQIKASEKYGKGT